MSRPLTIAALLCLALVPRAGAAVLRTLDGALHEGDVRIDTGALLVQPAAGSAVRVELSNLLSADFRSRAGMASAPPPLAPRWSARDIGAVAAPGTVRFNDGVITVRAGGTGIGGAADSGQFIMQSIAGDGQIVARLTTLQLSHPLAKAVLIFRASLDPAAPAVAVAFHAAGNTAFQHRPKPGAKTVLREGGAAELPVYMKLTRRDNTFSAYLSADGETWSTVGSQEVTLPTTAFVGLAVSSSTEHAITTATFDNVSVTRTLSLRTDARAADGTASQGVVLRNGSVLTGRVRSANASAISLARTREPAMTIPLARASVVFMTPLTADIASRLPDQREGVLLSNGDFFEGRLLDLNDSRIKLSSVLFGIKRFETRHVAAVSFGGMPRASPARYLLRAQDGSSLLFDEVELAAGLVHIKDPVLSQLVFPLAEVQQLTAGPSRVHPLTTLEPHPPTDKTVAVRGDEIAIRDRVVYELGGEYRLLSLQFAASREMPAAHSTSLSVTADGKKVYESDLQTSAHPPLLVRVDLTGVNRLEIIATTSGGQGQWAGVLISPLLVRAERAD